MDNIKLDRNGDRYRAVQAYKHFDGFLSGTNLLAVVYREYRRYVLLSLGY